MAKGRLNIDLTYARSALAVRQTVAHAFGIPLGREFTWDMLRELICALPAAELPEQIVIAGYPGGGELRKERDGLAEVFRELQRRYPDINVSVILY